MPHVLERFVLTNTDHGTSLRYTGELGTDLWLLGQRWGDVVAQKWEQTVAASLEMVAAEAERRAAVAPTGLEP